MNRMLMMIISIIILKDVIYCQKQCYKKDNPSIISNGTKLKLSTGSLQNFQSGSWTLVNTKIDEPQRFIDFKIPLKYINGKKPYQVVSSINNIQNYDDKSGLDFSISLQTNPTVILGTFTISTKAIWTTITINYIISARDDFRVGSFIADVTSLLSSTNTNINLTLNTQLATPWIGSQRKIFVFPFISGVKTSSDQINVNFKSSTFDVKSNRIKIGIQIKEIQQPIQMLLISYLIVSMQSSFHLSNLYDLSSTPSSINTFIGMTGIKTSTQKVANRMLKSNFKSNNKNKFQTFFVVKGLAIQTQSNLGILFAKDNQTQIIQCISQSRCYQYGGQMTYLQDLTSYSFSSKCIVCDRNFTLNFNTNICQCKKFYTKINATCIKKIDICTNVHQAFNQILQSCQCIVGYQRINQICTKILNCPQGYYFLNNKCLRMVFNPAITNKIVNKFQSNTLISQK